MSFRRILLEGGHEVQQSPGKVVVTVRDGFDKFEVLRHMFNCQSDKTSGIAGRAIPCFADDARGAQDNRRSRYSAGLEGRWLVTLVFP